MTDKGDRIGLAFLVIHQRCQWCQEDWNCLVVPVLHECMMTLDTLSENPWEDKDYLITATRLDVACSPVDERDHCEGDIKDPFVVC